MDPDCHAGRVRVEDGKKAVTEETKDLLSTRGGKRKDGATRIINIPAMERGGITSGEEPFFLRGEKKRRSSARGQRGPIVAYWEREGRRASE